MRATEDFLIKNFIFVDFPRINFETLYFIFRSAQFIVLINFRLIHLNYVFGAHEVNILYSDSTIKNLIFNKKFLPNLHIVQSTSTHLLT